MANQDRVGRLFQQVSGNQKAYRVYDDQLVFVDPADITKRVRLDAGSVTTATTRVLTAPDFDVALGTGAGARRNIVDTAGVFATPIVLTAAESGNWYRLDDAAGLDFTLPALSGAATNGINYTFTVNTTVTSNGYRITAQSGDLMRGHVLISDFDAAYTAPQILAAEADESNDLIITLAVAASGGRAGGWFDITAVDATGWFVRGQLLGDGTIVTIFS